MTWPQIGLGLSVLFSPSIALVVAVGRCEWRRWRTARGAR